MNLNGADLLTGAKTFSVDTVTIGVQAAGISNGLYLLVFKRNIATDLSTETFFRIEVHTDFATGNLCPYLNTIQGM